MDNDRPYLDAEEVDNYFEDANIRFDNTITTIDGTITHEEGDLYFKYIGIYIVDNKLGITITLQIEPDNSKTAATFQGTSYEMEFTTSINKIQQMTKNDFCNFLYNEILNSTDESSYFDVENEHNWKEFIDIIREYKYSLDDTTIITYSNIDDETNVPLNTILFELSHQITNFIDHSDYVNFDEHITKSATFGVTQDGGYRNKYKYKYMKYKNKYLQSQLFYNR
jgi:hypothetical protein